MQTVLDILPKPPCAETLGWHVLDARPADGWIRIGFEGKRAFTNPAGVIQGGFLAAMLDDTMGPALFVYTEGKFYAPTIDLNVSFLASAKVGPLFGEGQVVQMGKTIAFLEGKLMDADGVIVARATASCRVMEAARALG